MDERENYPIDEIEIDIGRIFLAIMNRGWLMILVAVLCAVLVFGGTYFFITPQYESSAMFYVNNNAFSVSDAALSISNGDLATSRGLVDSYIVILKTRETLNEVIDYSGVDLSFEELSGMITAADVDKTEIFRVTVTHPDPQDAEKIANAIAYILPNRISNIIDGTSAKIVDWAVAPAAPSSPSYTGNALIGFLVGLMLTAAVVVLREIFNTTIRSEEDIEQVCPHPVLALVPDMTSSKTDSHYYGYGEKKKKKKPAKTKSKAGKQTAALIGGNVSFVASEAYKRLRTKLQFSFADDSNCRVIGLSSALSGEGKSLTSINLAYTLAQLNKRVILLDCDMRRPTLAEKMSLNKKPGLSEYLTGQHGFKDVIQRYEENEETFAFHVISAGENPPNPMEMLSSLRMERLLGSLREAYDYVILDLPPMTEVTDAMAVAPKVDGMLLVVRQNYCDRIVLKDTAQQFAFIDAKILGIVFNCTSEYSGKYCGKVYYTPYYKRYYRRYSRDYGYYSENKNP
ncbi:MAG: polysaccharide biosynthesis tyrosine autokinase [Oscillospiraceae bacterium]|nr:polysaccharide biosynthesis tyrosine autokinase [Oscillospiraceae bacterium]